MPLPPFPAFLALAALLAAKKKPKARPKRTLSQPRVIAEAQPARVAGHDASHAEISPRSKMPPEEAEVTRSFARSVPEDLQAELRGWYGDSLDLSKIKVRRVGRSYARTLGNVILFPRRRDLSVRSEQFALVHETAHVWQYQNFGLTYIPHSIGDQLRALFSRSRETSAEEVYGFTYAPRKTLLEYTVEQQAQLIACAFAVAMWDDPFPMQKSCADWKELPAAQQRAWIKEIRASFQPDNSETPTLTPVPDIA